MSFTFGSLFAGIGGMDIGLERAGMKCAWQVEINPFCNQVLERHWPNVKRYLDVRDVGKHNLESVDLIAGGFPCQDISNAGNRAGIDGERSGLWSEFHRIICELRPRYVIVENVAALLIRGMGRVLGDLAASGYDAEWRVFRASRLGAPHRRERLFAIAYPVGQRKQGLLQGADFSEVGSAWLWGSHRQAFVQSLVNAPFERGDSWPQPLLRRMDDGLPARLDKADKDRIHGLGNSIVPQIPEWIGRRILGAEPDEHKNI
jgi:DNA (cytosine-5)-methyltransferase 1